jgi:predicted RNA-binding Zn-ribbon protein involved in translation (DUF1610 family)
MRVLFAILMAAVILAFGFGTLRSLARPRAAPKPEEAVPVLRSGTRVTFWCETCGTELLLVRKGTDAAPRHCGESMIKREEVPSA